MEETVGEILKGSTLQIVNHLRETPYATRQELAEALGLTVRGIEYHLKKLREANVIERIGSTKSGYWKVKV